MRPKPIAGTIGPLRPSWRVGVEAVGAMINDTTRKMFVPLGLLRLIAASKWRVPNSPRMLL